MIFGDGFNVEGWLDPWLSAANFTDTWRRASLSKANLTQLAKDGVKALRIYSQPSVLTADGLEADPEVYEPGRSWTPTDRNLALLADTIRECDALGIAVVLDLFHMPSEVWRRVLGDDRFADAWGEWGAWINKEGFNTSRIALELGNEVGPAAGWREAQERAIKQIRAHLPEVWIFVSDPHWQAIESLWNYEPIGGSRCAKAVHQYVPFLFTHQGMDWVESSGSWYKGVAGLKGANAIPYPSTERTLRPAKKHLVAAGNSELASNLKPFGRADLELLYRRAAEWMETTGQQVIITECGAGKWASVTSRNRWLKDNNDLAMKYGIPVIWFSLWDNDYQGDRKVKGFGFYWRDPHTMKLTPQVSGLKAALERGDSERDWRDQVGRAGGCDTLI